MHTPPPRFAVTMLLATATLGSLTLHANGQMHLTPTSDTVVDSSALMFATSGATWGRAINGEAFQAEVLLSHDGYQYTSWYTHDANRSVMIARRTIDGGNVGAWDVVNTGFRLANTSNDVHNTISLGLSRTDGTLHLSWDHHVHALNYARSSAGVATTDKTQWGPGMFTKTTAGRLLDQNIGSITYPMFFNTPSGDLQFAYRSGSSGNGQFKISTYAGGAWNTPLQIIGSTGTYVEGSFTSTSRNGYPNGYDYGPDGTLHTSWVWREDAGGANHDINYAASTDGGVTWQNGGGVTIANAGTGNPITINSPGIVAKALDLKQSLYNQQSQAVDRNGGVHALMWHRRQDEPAFAWQSGDSIWEPADSAYHHYYRDPQTGLWTVNRLPVEIEVNGQLKPLPIGRRGQIAADAAGNVYAIYTARDLAANPDYVYTAGRLVVAGASVASNYTDWSILYTGDVLLEGEPLIDSDRLFRDGILSIFVQEAASGTAMTGTKLHVIEFAVPEPATAAILGAGAIGVLAWRRR